MEWNMDLFFLIHHSTNCIKYIYQYRYNDMIILNDWNLESKTGS